MEVKPRGCHCSSLKSQQTKEGAFPAPRGPAMRVPDRIDGNRFRGGAFWLFAEEPPITRHASGVQPHELSLWFGAALVAIGVTVNLFSARRYMCLVGELSRGQFVDRSLSKQGVIVALFLALLGIAMTIYMIPVPGVSAERAACAAGQHACWHL
jgi:hypothetical protein